VLSIPPQRGFCSVTWRHHKTRTDTRADSNWSLERVYRPPTRWAA
jgi:hypothetical protein